VVQVSGEAKEFVFTTKSTKGTKVPLFVGRLRIPLATGMPFGTRTGYGSYLPRKNTKAGTDAAENTHNSQLSSWSLCLRGESSLSHPTNLNHTLSVAFGNI
jgi:hypothetical protein